MTETSEETKNARSTPVRRTLVGTVVSDGMDKTITVLFTRKVKHPKYKKYLKKSHKVLAHDEENEGKLGDRVRVMECRPYSKRKSWRLLEVLSSSAAQLAEEEKEEKAEE